MFFRLLKLALPDIRYQKVAHTHETLLTSIFPILYTLLTVLMTWPLSQNLTTAIPSDSFDGWQNYWNLWWIKVALIERIQSPLTTDLLYTLTGVALYFHTLNPFNGLVILPLQLSAGLIPAYNGMVFLSWVLGGYGVSLLTRWILRPKVYPLNDQMRMPDNAFQKQSLSVTQNQEERRSFEPAIFHFPTSSFLCWYDFHLCSCSYGASTGAYASDEFRVDSLLSAGVAPCVRPQTQPFRLAR